MSKEKGFNGYKNWSQWNVTLWINNDEGLYRKARSLARRHGKDKAAEMMAEEYEGQSTPDGARYSKTAIRAALVGI